jgi:hypothetical protein
LCVVVVVVAGVLLVAGWAVEELAALPPHPATVTVAASTATVVRIAVSGFFIGRAPKLARGLGGSAYQPFVAPTAVG